MTLECQFLATTTTVSLLLWLVTVGTWLDIWLYIWLYIWLDTWLDQVPSLIHLLKSIP